MNVARLRFVKWMDARVEPVHERTESQEIERPVFWNVEHGT
jgi:hypothetical protein